MTPTMILELFIRHEVPFARCWLMRREGLDRFYLMHGDMTMEMADQMEQWARAMHIMVHRVPNKHKFKTTFELVLPDDKVPCLFGPAA